MLNAESSQPDQPPLPLKAIERLWEIMLKRYGSQFIDRWRDIDPDALKRAWAEDMAGFTRPELERGVEAMSRKLFCPSLPEFMALCRPLADARTEWVEACTQMEIRLRGKGVDTWSRPQVYWAACALGAYTLRTSTWEQIRSRWEHALATAKGEPVPDYLAPLPAPGQHTASPEKTQSSIGAMKQALKAVPAGREWAVKLMRREAEGEVLNFLQKRTWREVLGFAVNVKAIEALERMMPQSTENRT